MRSRPWRDGMMMASARRQLFTNVRWRMTRRSQFFESGGKCRMCSGVNGSMLLTEFTVAAARDSSRDRMPVRE
jgi:hypothetical protein